MKVIFFGYSVGWGLTFHLTQLSIALRKLGVDIYVISDGKEQVPGLHKLLVEVRIPIINIYNSDFGYKMDQFLKNPNDIIFHCQGFRQVKFVAKLLKDVKKTTIVLTVNAYRHGEWYKRLYCWSVRLLYSKYITAWVFPSHFARRDFQFKSYIPNAYVIPLGIEQPNYDKNLTEEIRKKYNLNSEDKYFIYLAQFSKHKRHKFLVLSIAPLLRSRDNVKLLLFGSGKYMESIINLTKKYNIEDKVNFYGRISRSEIPIILSLIKGRAINVVPSSTETFGHNIIEPLFYSIPTVSFDVGISEKVIEDFYNGFVLSQNASPHDFRTKVEYILDHLQEFSNSMYGQMLSWEEVAKRYILLYNMLIDEKNKYGKDF